MILSLEGLYKSMTDAKQRMKVVKDAYPGCPHDHGERVRYEKSVVGGARCPNAAEACIAHVATGTNLKTYISDRANDGQ